MTEGIVGKFVRVGKREQVPLEMGKKWDKEMLKNTFAVNSVADEALAKLKEKGGKVSKDQWEVYEDPEKVIERDKELIEAHVDRRIQLFFMQLISVYKTPYHFEWIEANDEYGKGSNFKLEHDGKKMVFPTQAAHSSTLPCLIAYPREEWEDGDEPEGFVYLKYAHSYLQQNGTVELARYVNQSDILLDGTHKSSKLRNEAVKIVNKVAKGRYGPREGMLKFMAFMEDFIEKGIEKAPEGDARAFVLGAYLERVQEVELQMSGDEGYFDQILGVNVEHERENILRDEVYRRRYSLIQECESIESKIARDILDAQNAMLGKNKTSMKKVDYRLRYALLEDVNPLFRRKLERLFCTSLEQLQYGVEKNEERLRKFEGKERLRSFREKHKVAVGNLKRTLRRRFREMSSAELNYRSELFKGLRVKLNNWYQREFVAEFERKYPVEPMSIPMVSRMEQRTRANDKVYLTPEDQRRKDIGEAKAKKIADTFGVDAGLFLPAVVSSMY